MFIAPTGVLIQNRTSIHLAVFAHGSKVMPRDELADAGIMDCTKFDAAQKTVVFTQKQWYSVTF